MPILATLKKEVAGGWASLADLFREARRRQTTALGALSFALSASPEEQRELAQGEGVQVLLELARDLRVPKGARLASARCLLEAGVPAHDLGELFAGAGDLVTDPRLGGTARKLVEQGLPAALQSGGELARVSLAAAGFARAVQAAASAVGPARAKELLETAPGSHAGAAAARFALGDGELPEREAWQELLDGTCAAHRKAPAAARRIGLAPAWPPNVPDAFLPLVSAAEARAAPVQPVGAAAMPAVPAAPRAGPARARPGPPPPVPPLPEHPNKTLAPPIRRSPFKRPLGTVVEVPTRAATKAMAPIGGRPAPDAAASRAAPLPGMATLLRPTEEVRLDPRGQRIPRADRWSGAGFGWETPALPPESLPSSPKVAMAAGPFAQRIRSVFEDRPEAIDRLCAAAEARLLLLNESRLVEDLEREASREVWKGRILPPGQAARLREIEHHASLPQAWRTAARVLLAHLKTA